MFRTFGKVAMNNFSRLKALDAQNVPITVEDRCTSPIESLQGSRSGSDEKDFAFHGASIQQGESDAFVGKALKGYSAAALILLDLLVLAAAEALLLWNPTVQTLTLPVVVEYV